MSKELLAATRQELESWPDTSLTEDAQGKHRKITLRYKEHTRLVVFASTPSDQRALPNHIALVRRELRGMGASKTHLVAPRARTPFIPATHAPLKNMEIIMKPTNKIKAIFSAIGDLRYGEMLTLSQLLSAAANDAKMRRSVPNDWAQMLQAIVDCEAEKPSEQVPA